MIYRIYNVEFKQKKDLFMALGYSCVMADSQIKKQYGNIENMIKKRLSLEKDTEITTQLKKMRDDYYQVLKLNQNKQDNNFIKINKLAFEVYKVAYTLLSTEQKKSILATVASLNSTSIDDIEKNL